VVFPKKLRSLSAYFLAAFLAAAFLTGFSAGS
jgi:hypothetical protein